MPPAYKDYKHNGIGHRLSTRLRHKFASFSRVSDDGSIAVNLPATLEDVVHLTLDKILEGLRQLIRYLIAEDDHTLTAILHASGANNQLPFSGGGGIHTMPHHSSASRFFLPKRSDAATLSVVFPLFNVTLASTHSQLLNDTFYPFLPADAPKQPPPRPQPKPYPTTRPYNAKTSFNKPYSM
jgi:hypothetical protein